VTNGEGRCTSTYIVLAGCPPLLHIHHLDGCGEAAHTAEPQWMRTSALPSERHSSLRSARSSQESLVFVNRSSLCTHQQRYTPLATTMAPHSANIAQQGQLMRSAPQVAALPPPQATPDTATPTQSLLHGDDVKNQSMAVIIVGIFEFRGD